MREDQIRPFVVVDFDVPDGWTINLTIQNVGSTVARDVHLSFDQAPKRAIMKNRPDTFAQTALLQQGIPNLPPGKTIRTFFDSFIERNEADLPMKYTVTVTYKSSTGKTMAPEEYILDLTFYKGLLYERRRGIDEVAKTLEAVQKEMHKWTEGINGLRVYTTDLRSHQHRSLRWMRLRPLPEDASRPKHVLHRMRVRGTGFLDRLGL